MPTKTTILTSSAVLALIVGTFAAILPQSNSAQDTQMKKDITISLGETIARGGGMVLLQVIEIEENTFDQLDQPQIVSTDAQISVINVPVLKGEEYVYRFEMPDGYKGTTNRFSVGTTTLSDTEGKTQLLYHHIDANSSWPLSYSRRVASVVQPAAAHEQYACEAHHDILVCDASSILAGPIPE